MFIIRNKSQSDKVIKDLGLNTFVQEIFEISNTGG